MLSQSHSPLSPDSFSDLMRPFGDVDLTKPIAVAVSGGADSLCLTLLLHQWIKPLGGTIAALTVDHGLRPESASEAEQVHHWLQKQGIYHETLLWEGEKPTSRLQEKARHARYELLEGWCLDHGASLLATAHHADDQVETVLQRLSRGSGLKGLCGMFSQSSRRFGRLIRPLLGVPKSALVETLKQWQQPFITDPSNKNEMFDRVRWRHITPALAELGLTTDSILKSIRRLQQTEESLEFLVTRYLKRIVQLSPLGYAQLDVSEWKEQVIDSRHRALARLLLCIGNHTYAPAYETIHRLDSLLLESPFKGHTGGGCYLFPSHKTVFIAKENRFPPAACPYTRGMIWDDRFLLDFEGAPENIHVKSMGDFQAERLAAMCHTHPAILASLPVLCNNKGEILFIPHFPALGPHYFEGNVMFAPRQGLTL